MTIKEAVDTYAASFNKELDPVFKSEVRSQIMIARAEAIKRKADKNRSSLANFEMQVNCMHMEKADIAECCTLNIGCDVSKTVDGVPSTISIANSVSDGFSYVGSVDNSNAFGYIKPEDLEFMLLDRFFKSKGKLFWTYINNKIYVLNGHVATIRVRGLFSNPDEIYKLNDCDNDNIGCGNILTIPDDILYIVFDLLDKRFRPVTPISVTSEEVKLEEQPKE